MLGSGVSDSEESKHLHDRQISWAAAELTALALELGLANGAPPILAQAAEPPPSGPGLPSSSSYNL